VGPSPLLSIALRFVSSNITGLYVYRHCTRVLVRETTYVCINGTGARLAVSTAARLRAGRSGVLIPVEEDIFLFSETSRPALGPPTQLPI
jgi:hypothetical protein